MMKGEWGMMAEGWFLFHILIQQIMFHQQRVEFEFLCIHSRRMLWQPEQEKEQRTEIQDTRKQNKEKNKNKNKKERGKKEEKSKKKNRNTKERNRGFM
jgi:hypothetical protein